MTYLNLLWHFHQPWYIFPGSNRIERAIITFRTLYNYYPMAKMIQESGTTLTCNFTVPLLLQIKKIDEGEIIDSFQEMLIEDSENDSVKIKIFLEDIPERIKNKNEILRKLMEKFFSQDISKREISDLKIWMHLVCFHPCMVRWFPEIKQLIEKGAGFDSDDRKMLVKLEKEIFSQTLGFYNNLWNSGLIEISITPGYHPIMPLVYDLSIAKKTKTSLQIPDIEFRYPEDVRGHIEMGFETAEKIFGKNVFGIWPAEGSISNEIFDMLVDYNIKWIGADEQILHNTDVSDKEISSTIYRWKDSFCIFFRNHEFSDRIGFVYHWWDEKSAAEDLFKKIEDFSENNEKILTIILDGENPWEWYRDGGSIFLPEFYGRINSSKKIKPITFSSACNLSMKNISLSNIPPGSWMGLHFDNWIGNPDANRLWQILANARKTVYQQTGKTPLHDGLRNLILMAESSDFFWWMSVSADITTKTKFYSLFQAIISSIYQTIGLKTPQEVLSAYLPATQIGQPDRAITATIDGKLTSFFEWSGASEIKIEQLWTTFQPFDLPVKKLFYGYDMKNLYFRLDISQKVFRAISVEIKEKGVIFSFDIPEGNFVFENIALVDFLEIKIPWEKIGSNDDVAFALKLKTSDTEIRIPPAGFVVFKKKIFDDDWTV